MKSWFRSHIAKVLNYLLVRDLFKLDSFDKDYFTIKKIAFTVKDNSILDVLDKNEIKGTLTALGQTLYVILKKFNKRKKKISNGEN